MEYTIKRLEDAEKSLHYALSSLQIRLKEYTFSDKPDSELFYLASALFQISFAINELKDEKKS